MMNEFRNIFTVVLFGLSISLTAQQSINSAGGDSGTGQLSHSIGQITYTAISSLSDDALMLQGVQIPYELYGLSCAGTVPTELNVMEIGFGTANARVSATWYNPNNTTDCEVRGGRIMPSTIGSDTLEFANLDNTRITKLTDGTSLTFELPLYNNPYGITFILGQTYGFEVRCLCEDETNYTIWSGITPEATFVVPAPPPGTDLGEANKLFSAGIDRMNIYPNPAEEMVNIELDVLEEGSIEIILINAMGQTIMNVRSSGKSSISRLDISDLSTGVYMLSVRTATGMITERLIIQ